MKPLNQMTDEELIQYASWQQERWSRIIAHLIANANALTTHEKTARKQAALTINAETFDDYLTKLSAPLVRSLGDASA